MNILMPSGTPSVTASINESVRVHITALRADYEIDRPVYALNWFDSRWLWVYNFYNLLAARSVFKVRGVPFFKARVAKTLHGSSTEHRSVFLVVRYPGISHFQSMLQSRYFQAISIIRSLTVVKFTFGLSTRTDIRDIGEFEEQFRVSKANAYAIYHYRLTDQLSKEILNINERVADLASPQRVEVAFSSRVSARLYPQKGSDHPVAVDTIMDGCMIMQAESQQQIEQLIASAEFQVLLATTENSFIATLDRIL